MKFFLAASAPSTETRAGGQLAQEQGEVIDHPLRLFSFYHIQVDWYECREVFHRLASKRRAEHGTSE